MVMKRVYAYVVADILHVGHVRHLQAARQLGDRLQVGVLTTGACREKKPSPITSSVDRMELVRALRCVDSVCWQREYSPMRNVKRYRPDILAESEDHAAQPANSWCRRHGIQVVSLPYTHGISSSLIKERIINDAKKGKRG